MNKILSSFAGAQLDRKRLHTAKYLSSTGLMNQPSRLGLTIKLFLADLARVEGFVSRKAGLPRYMGLYGPHIAGQSVLAAASVKVPIVAFNNRETQ